MNRAIIIAGIAVVLAAVPLTVFLLLQRVELRKEASTPSGTVTIKLSPETGEYSVGDEIPLSISFNPNGTRITGVGIRIGYQTSAAEPPLTFMEDSIKFNSTLTSDKWVCPVQQTKTESNQYYLELACVNTSAQGYTSQTDVPLVDFKVKVASQPQGGSITLDFDPEKNIFTDADSQKDVLLTPSTKGEYTINSRSGSSTENEEDVVTIDLTNGQILTTSKPTFKGNAPASSQISIKVDTSSVVGNVTTSSAGIWTWAPSTALADGDHTINVTSTSSQGNTSSVSRSFTIKTASSQSTTTTIVPTTTTTTAQPRVSTTSSTPKGGVPGTAFPLPTFIILFSSLIFLILGLRLS